MFFVSVQISNFFFESIKNSNRKLKKYIQKQKIKYNNKKRKKNNKITSKIYIYNNKKSLINK